MAKASRGLNNLQLRYWRLEPYVELRNGTLRGLIYEAFVDSLALCANLTESEVERSMTLKSFARQSEMLPTLFQGSNSAGMPVVIKADSLNTPNEFVGLIETNGLAWLYQADPPETNILLTGLSAVWPIMLLTLVLTGYAALIIWVAERRVKIDRQFNTSFISGFLESFWFAYISATTVGYGDKVPKSTVGKVLALLWILCGISLMSSFTATMTTLLNNLASPPKNEIPPMHDVQIGVMNTSIDHRLVMERGGRPVDFDNLDSLIDALQHHQVDSIALDPNVYCTTGEKLNRTNLELRMGITDATVVGYIYNGRDPAVLECMKRVSFFKQHEFDKHISEKFAQLPTVAKAEVTIESNMFGESGHLVILLSAAALLAICGLLRRWSC